MDQKLCVHCGETFHRTYHSARQWETATFCSHRCTALARHAREAQFKPQKPCETCGENFTKNPRYTAAQWERARYCSRACQHESKRLERALCACGCGQRVAKVGSRYRQGHNPHDDRIKVFQRSAIDGKVRWRVSARDGTKVHWARIVMRNELGRDLLPTEVVHHIDGDSENDAPDNLQVYASHSEHMRDEYLNGRLTGMH